MTNFQPENLLADLLNAPPQHTNAAPRDAHGLYALFDHLGKMRYIGSTRAEKQSLFTRIHHRHRSGDEWGSHYFSRMYNTGRMWRDRLNPESRADADLAKALRRAFIADHCRAAWVCLPESADIALLEKDVLKRAPAEATAWNGCKMDVYDEPVALVDATLRRLGWGAAEHGALERQRQRFLRASGRPPALANAHVSRLPSGPPTFPKGPFRFCALDVETANSDRASICQVGVACVRADNSIVTWVTHVDPQTERWVFTYLHGISARSVQGAPTFAQVLPMLREALAGNVVYQHSGFDRTAFAAACARFSLPLPSWEWRDSVAVARTAWPELTRNGGHGLASLKQHLGLVFEHHDAGEDARAAAEVVLRAEGIRAERTAQASRPVRAAPGSGAAAFPSAPVQTPTGLHAPRVIGITEVTQANIDYKHIYFRPFFGEFPKDAIGGSNAVSAALREIRIDWGGASPVMTDLDGEKKFCRKRGWVREFFAHTEARAGDIVSVEETSPYCYRLTLRRGGGPAARTA